MFVPFSRNSLDRLDPDREVQGTRSTALKMAANRSLWKTIQDLLQSMLLSCVFNLLWLIIKMSATQIQVKWSRPEVLLLLSLYRDREQLFKDKKTKKKTLWEEIARDMRQQCYEYTGSQCETKFKNLKQNYTKTVDHNNVSGNDKKTCPYFDELSEIFGMTPCVKPIAVCSNRATSPTSGFQVDSCSSSTSGRSMASSMQDLSSDNECLPPKEKKRRGKKSAQSKESLVDLFKEYRLEQKLKE